MTLTQENSVLKWGGLAGILGSIIFIGVFFIVGIFVGSDPTELEEWAIRFPDIRPARIFENGLYLLSLIIWIPSFLALYRALREQALASALFGATLGILGLVIMSAGALPHIAHTPLSEIYHSTDVTTADQASIALMWQATWGIFDAILIAGLAFIPLAFLTLGSGMLTSSIFSTAHAWMTIILGVLGIGAIGYSLVYPDAPSAAIVVFGLIIFHAVIGWKLFRQSAS